jgi:hypothetical protein
MSNLEKMIREQLNKDHVSFAELSRLDGFKGEMALFFEDKNIMLWPKLSEEAVEILDRLRGAGEFHYHPTLPLIYLVDGVSLNMPIAKSDRHYSEMHWLPVVLKRGMVTPSCRCQQPKPRRTITRTERYTRAFAERNGWKVDAERLRHAAARRLATMGAGAATLAHRAGHLPAHASERRDGSRLLVQGRTQASSDRRDAICASHEVGSRAEGRRQVWARTMYTPHRQERRLVGAGLDAVLRIRPPRREHQLAAGADYAGGIQAIRGGVRSRVRATEQSAGYQ